MSEQIAGPSRPGTTSNPDSCAAARRLSSRATRISWSTMPASSLVEAPSRPAAFKACFAASNSSISACIWGGNELDTHVFASASVRE